MRKITILRDGVDPGAGYLREGAAPPGYVAWTSEVPDEPEAEPRPGRRRPFPLAGLILSMLESAARSEGHLSLATAPEDIDLAALEERLEEFDIADESDHLLPALRGRLAEADRTRREGWQGDLHLARIIEALRFILGTPEVIRDALTGERRPNRLLVRIPQDPEPVSALVDGLAILAELLRPAAEADHAAWKAEALSLAALLRNAKANAYEDEGDAKGNRAERIVRPLAAVMAHARREPHAGHIERALRLAICVGAIPGYRETIDRTVAADGFITRLAAELKTDPADLAPRRDEYLAALTLSDDAPVLRYEESLEWSHSTLRNRTSDLRKNLALMQRIEALRDTMDAPAALQGASTANPAPVKSLAKRLDDEALLDEIFEALPERDGDAFTAESLGLEIAEAFRDARRAEEW
jgi:hypothetical protein